MPAGLGRFWVCHGMMDTMLRQIFVFGFILCSCSAWAGLEDTVARVKPSIVGIGSFSPIRSPRGRFQGTGFVVADGRHVITNLHVLPKSLDDSNLERLGVFIGVGRLVNFRPAMKLAQDPAHDLVVLKIEGEPLPALRLGDSGRVREGQLLALTGFPLGALLGLYPATHPATVAAITPNFTKVRSTSELSVELLRRADDQYMVFQLDAVSYPGNSGSPLYDPETGQVLGVINMTFVKGSKENLIKDPSGITYAIPSRYVAELLNSAGVGAH
jgi:S1-C subfamily serine protease